jgi:RNA recognition motif-containing protein
MLQAGPIGKNKPLSRLFWSSLLSSSQANHRVRITVNVHLPKDRISMAHQGYGFCEFGSEDDAEYACKIMNQIKLYGKPIRINKVDSFQSL